MVYIVCYDLSASLEDRNEQVAYWLNLLNSTFITPPSDLWRVFIVGTKLDKYTDFQLPISTISSLKAEWPYLPLHDQHFCISSCNMSGVRDLLQALEQTCSILRHHLLLIPSSYKSILQSLKVETGFIHNLYELVCFRDMTSYQFWIALKYLHAIGELAMTRDLYRDTICTSPTWILKQAHKFFESQEYEGNGIFYYVVISKTLGVSM